MPDPFDNTQPRNSRKLPASWRKILLDKYEAAPERQAWQDYNCAAGAYFQFQRGTRPDNHSLFQISDAPAFPDPDDFPDLDKERDCERIVTPVGVVTNDDFFNLSSLNASQLSEMGDEDLYLLEV